LILAPPLHATRGASKGWLFTVRTSNNAPRDITGAKVWFTIKNRVEDVAALVAKRNAAAGGVDNQILVVVPQTGISLGQFKVFLDLADTSALDPAAMYWCDAFVQLVGGPPLDRQQVMRNRQLVIDPAVTTTF
jgi:hypothetical protein